ncbi:branched-chain amino acid ABC transporter permease [Anaerotruncus massiliensis (ex Liu et al. 2021)]|uniref:Branched-chain amino acid ABC transporter permease n=2 Tax=Anaerotruncus TaxID=244127 RepID=A0A498CZG5_9FIRM|nr:MULTISPECIES: branched-chain amino acid ABC transporter permease [Anaerotruncus]MBC3938570.1 branched-chain amino acid ABC transporter permease [Anaerotruncus massiliensis (ex Togo et al. 2019)]RLL12173.1 branched-chain amino acid ABC transporter permease [Anaerotruncus massiliensis (ex Liu et al. 2021)]
MSFFHSIFIFSCITILNVAGVFLLTGLTGLFSFGQAAFMAIGAYASGIAVVKFELPFPLALLIGVLVSAATAVVIGYPTLKLRRDYFTLITFGFGEAVAALLNYMVKLTGGSTGLSGIPRKTGTWLVVLSTVLVVFMVRNLKYSSLGRVCIAIKNDELTAKSFGIDVFTTKMKIFVLSAVLSAYAGGLYGFFISYVEPAMFRWTKSAEWVIFVFFGGVNSLTGSVVSSFLLTMLPEALRFAADYKIVIYCVLVLLILNFRPKGLFGEWELPLGRLLRPAYSRTMSKNGQNEDGCLL